MTKAMSSNDMTPEQMVRRLRELRSLVPMDGGKLDAEPILRELAEMRRAIPFLDEGPPRPAIDGRASALDGMPLGDEQDFEYASLTDALESFQADLGAALDRKRAQLTAEVMKIYYAAEEAARDPENAHLIEYVERMREAYQRQYGRPIPPKPKE